MERKKNLQKASSLGLCIMVISMVFIGLCTATQPTQTTLEITAVRGGFGKVSVIVKNIGDETAENITISISVKGGLFDKINITKICSGCGQCSNSIAPNETKTESTASAGRIMGFGLVSITVSAQAANADKIEKIINGFALGPLVIVS